MNRALRLAPVDRSTVPTLSPAPISSLRPSLRPTFTPSSRRAANGSTATASVQPPTQRSAALPTHLDVAAHLDAQYLLASMRFNVHFLEAMLQGKVSALALGALEDLQHGIDRLTRRLEALRAPTR